MSPDALVIFNLLSAAKNRAGMLCQFISLGAWGGENLINARPRLIVQHRMHHFPTMGYGFNKSFWHSFAKLKHIFFRNPSADWAIAAAESLPECVVVITPTLSRVWHIGRSGLHTWNIQSNPNWNSSNDELLRPESCATLDTLMRNWFGFQCSNFNRSPLHCRDTCHREREAEFPTHARHERVPVNETGSTNEMRVCKLS